MIYLIRHSETDWNIERRIQGHTDIPLNETGRTQAIGARSKLKDLNIDTIYCSPLSRALETAQILNQELNLEIVQDDRLKEWGHGIIEGRYIADITDKMWHKMHAKPEYSGIEPIENVFLRTKNLLCEIKDEKLKNVLLVSHAGCLRMFLYATANKTLDVDDFIKSYSHRHINNLELIPLD